MRKTKFKKWLVLLGLVLLTYPFVEYLTPLRLAGMVNRTDQAAEVEKFNWQSWFDGSFQQSVLNYINDNIGLFPLFIRTHNQLEYSLFGNIYTGDVARGKNNFLFEQIYLDTYFGKDFAGLDKIEKNTQKLKVLQDSLAARGKFLMFCLAASKASYYPEYLPYKEDRDSTNPDYYVREFKEQGVNHINWNTWFGGMKDSLGPLLFPKYGIHWSHYSAMMVTDSLVEYMEAKTGWNLPNMEITATPYSDKARYYDNDIAHSMNLFKEPQPENSLIYPEFRWEKRKPRHSRKKVLIIGDSFTWDIFEYSKMEEGCFEEVQFWFYNQIVHTEEETGGRRTKRLPTLTRHLDLAEVLREFDAFIILSSKPNLVSFGWNFIDEATKTLQDPDYVPRERNNPYLEDQARHTREWREELQKRADERNITLDSMINIYLHDPNYKPW